MEYGNPICYFKVLLEIRLLEFNKYIGNALSQ